MLGCLHGGVQDVLLEFAGPAFTIVLGSQAFSAPTPSASGPLLFLLTRLPALGLPFTLPGQFFSEASL